MTSLGFALWAQNIEYISLRIGERDEKFIACIHALGHVHSGGRSYQIVYLRKGCNTTWEKHIQKV